LGGRLYGFKRSSSSDSTADVLVEDFDNTWGLETRAVPVAYQKRWNKEYLTIYGENHNIGTTIEDCSDFDGDNNYMVGTAISSTRISSTNVGDTYRSGGAQIVALDYLDINWNKQTTYVPMSGNKSIGAVNIFRPMGLYIIKAGKSGVACGKITLTDRLRPLLKICQGNTISRAGYSYIPTGKNYLITDTYCSNLLGNAAVMDFYLLREEPYTYSGATNYIEVTRPLGNGVATYANLSRPLNMPYLVDEKCRVRTRILANPGTGSGQIVLRGILVDKKSS
jgi:hypothetical protein